MTPADRLTDQRQEIRRLAAKHGAGNIAIFGSVARGEETSVSDVDLLIDVTGPTTSWFPGGLAAELGACPRNAAAIHEGRTLA
jgi:predicted nucleotidyltransferase